jgi:hypothetical protein
VPGVAPQHLGRLVLGGGEKIHHLAEQHGLVKLQGRHGDVGEREHDCKPALSAQQPDDPTVDAEELHTIPSAEPTNHVILSASEGSHRRLPRHEILRYAQDDSHFLHSPRKRSTVRTKKLTPNGMAMSLKS